MPGDRDRFSYDEKQQYRSVVAQQGRVTFPADWNESQEIFAEEQRKEALDIVGPAGTPDDGYRIDVPQSSPNYDFLIEPGTMYVGGERVFLPGQITYFTQPDWIDAPPPNPDPVLEFIYLQLQEQEVSAVEDSTLKDVALGGPDTTQRNRLLQHIVRTPTQAKTCPEALLEQIAAWLAQGLTFDQATMRLNSLSRLKVGFDQSATPPDPCEPTASGGYLGAENQLIRVRLTSQNEFVWGFDDSSFFYRVDVIDNQTLRLQTPPVDSFHQPRANQAIEIPRSEALLSDGEFIAYDIGRVDTLAAAYNADTQTITLPTPLTPEFLPPKGTPRLFVRVWEQSLKFVAGTPVTLGNTGVQVTLTANSFQARGLFHVGDFWAFAVRPSTPVEVYPHRYLDAPQPPEGPRLWACPLAVLEWSTIAGTAGNIVTGQRIADCRVPFDNLVDLTRRKGGCCVLNLKPDDLAKTSLQSIVDGFSGRGQVTICFAPGQYLLPAPLVLGPQHAGIALEGCHPEVSVSAAPGSEGKFLDGMFVLTSTSNISIRGLSFHLPLPPLTGVHLAGLTPSDLTQRLNGPNAELISSGIGIRITASANIEVANCAFSLQVPPPPGQSAFEAAIMLTSFCHGLTVRGNLFQHSGSVLEINNANGTFGVRFGVLIVPTTLASLTTNVTGAAPVFNVGGAVLPSIFDDAVITGNRFIGLSAPVFLSGELGTFRIEDNTVTDCASGFFVVSLRTLSSASQLLTSTSETRTLADAFAADPVLLRGVALARAYPLPAGFEPAANQKVSAAPAAFNPRPPANLQLSAIDTRGFVLAAIETTMELAAFSKLQITVQLSLVVTGNQIDATSIDPATGGTVSHTALLIWADQAPQNAAVVDANECRSVTAGTTALPTVTLLFVNRGAITGNVIINEGLVTGAQGECLAVSSTGIAITGNALRGSRAIPPRPGILPPFNSWGMKDVAHVYSVRQRGVGNKWHCSTQPVWKRTRDAGGGVVRQRSKRSVRHRRSSPRASRNQQASRGSAHGRRTHSSPAGSTGIGSSSSMM